MSAKLYISVSQTLSDALVCFTVSYDFTNEKTDFGTRVRSIPVSNTAASRKITPNLSFRPFMQVKTILGGQS